MARTHTLLTLAGAVAVGATLGMMQKTAESASDSDEPTANTPEVPESWAATTKPFDLPVDLLASQHGDESDSRIIVVGVTVDLSADAAWKLWASSEGIASWLTGFDEDTGAPNANVAAHVGGPFELYFASSYPDGYRGSEGCRVLSYLPGKMLSFTWNNPPYFRNIRDTYTHVVVTFDELTRADGSAITTVTLTNLGWPDSAFVSDDQIAPGSHAAAFGYFSQAWPSVMNAFQSKAAEAAESLGYK